MKPSGNAVLQLRIATAAKTLNATQWEGVGRGSRTVMGSRFLHEGVRFKD